MLRVQMKRAIPPFHIHLHGVPSVKLMLPFFSFCISEPREIKSSWIQLLFCSFIYWKSPPQACNYHRIIKVSSSKNMYINHPCHIYKDTINQFLCFLVKSKKLQCTYALLAITLPDRVNTLFNLIIKPSSKTSLSWLSVLYISYPYQHI